MLKGPSKPKKVKAAPTAEETAHMIKEVDNAFANSTEKKLGKDFLMVCIQHAHNTCLSWRRGCSHPVHKGTFFFRTMLSIIYAVFLTAQMLLVSCWLRTMLPAAPHLLLYRMCVMRSLVGLADKPKRSTQEKVQQNCTYRDGYPEEGIGGLIYLSLCVNAVRFVLRARKALKRHHRRSLCTSERLSSPTIVVGLMTGNTSNRIVYAAQPSIQSFSLRYTAIGQLHRKVTTWCYTP